MNDTYIFVKGKRYYLTDSGAIDSPRRFAWVDDFNNLLTLGVANAWPTEGFAKESAVWSGYAIFMLADAEVAA